MQMWQVPLLAMAVVALAEWGVSEALRRWRFRVNWKLARAVGFGAAILLAAVLLLINYLATADKLANVISAVAAVVTLWWTYRAFQRPVPPPPTPPKDPAD